MSSLLAKTISLKVIQAVILFINTYEQDMIAVENENQKMKTKTDGIIFIICLFYHCWGIIIVYPYFIWINVFIWINETKQRINELNIGYITNPS